MNKKSYWLSISVFVLILIWTVYYYAMQYTGGFADLKDSIVCGIVGLICIVFIVKRTIDFLKNKKIVKFQFVDLKQNTAYIAVKRTVISLLIFTERQYQKEACIMEKPS